MPSPNESIKLVQVSNSSRINNAYIFIFLLKVAQTPYYINIVSDQTLRRKKHNTFLLNGIYLHSYKEIRFKKKCE